MRTAVQLLSGGSVETELVWGDPAQVASGTLGPVAVFPADRIVAYLFRTPRATTLFVFRTLAVADTLAASVPGVHPRVRLLIHLRSKMRIRSARRLFGHMLRRGVRPSLLSDDFYVRVSFALGGRITDQRRLRILLQRELTAAAHGSEKR